MGQKSPKPIIQTEPIQSNWIGSDWMVSANWIGSVCIFQKPIGLDWILDGQKTLDNRPMNSPSYQDPNLSPDAQTHRFHAI